MMKSANNRNKNKIVPINGRWVTEMEPPADLTDEKPNEGQLS